MSRLAARRARPRCTCCAAPGTRPPLDAARGALRERGAADPHLAVAWCAGLVELRRGGPGGGRVTSSAAGPCAVRYAEPLRLLPAASALAERCWVTGTPDPRLDGAAELLAQAATRPGTEWSAGELAVWLRRLGRDVDAADPPAGIALRA